MTVISVRDPSSKTVDLVHRTSDWGVSVSEAAGRKSAGRKALSFAGFVAFAAASLFVIPILAGTLLFSASRGVLIDLGIVGAFVAMAIFFNALSRKGPKNALQIDYKSSEIRLGSINSAGAFVRHKVCPLRSIDSVAIDTSMPQAPALKLIMFSETATIRFSNTAADSLAELATRIQIAADEARAAPIRSRIVSRINGFEAGMREISRRVASRVNSSFA